VAWPERYLLGLPLRRPQSTPTDCLPPPSADPREKGLDFSSLSRPFVCIGFPPAFPFLFFPVVWLKISLILMLFTFTLFCVSITLYSKESDLPSARFAFFPIQAVLSPPQSVFCSPLSLPRLAAHGPCPHLPLRSGSQFAAGRRLCFSPPLVLFAFPARRLRRSQQLPPQPCWFSCVAPLPSQRIDLFPVLQRRLSPRGIPPGTRSWRLRLPTGEHIKLFTHCRCFFSHFMAAVGL